MKKISVVIPMYNSFHMMEQNLNKLSMQKDAEIEIIIVDDCSKDDSLEKAREYASKSELNIIVVQNEKNGGPGVSRNNGIKHASGDYITFVDSDDYLSENFSSVVIPILEQGYDCVIFDYVNVKPTGEVLSHGKSIGMCELKPGEMLPKTALVYTYGSTCGKIYKRDIIVDNDARFGEFFRNEDMLFTKVALSYCQRIYYCNEELYMYVQHSSSLMHNDSLLDEKNCQIAFAGVKERLQGRGLDEEILAMELREVLNNSVMIMVARKDNKKKIKEYIRNNYQKKHLENKYFDFFPGYVRIISRFAYRKRIMMLSLIWKYKHRKKKKDI